MGYIVIGYPIGWVPPQDKTRRFQRRTPNALRFLMLCASPPRTKPTAPERTTSIGNSLHKWASPPQDKTPKPLREQGHHLGRGGGGGFVPGGGGYQLYEAYLTIIIKQYKFRLMRSSKPRAYDRYLSISKSEPYHARSMFKEMQLFNGFTKKHSELRNIFSNPMCG